MREKDLEKGLNGSEAHDEQRLGTEREAGGESTDGTLHEKLPDEKPNRSREESPEDEDDDEVLEHDDDGQDVSFSTA
jgi:hypothetical protein